MADDDLKDVPTAPGPEDEAAETGAPAEDESGTATAPEHDGTEPPPAITPDDVKEEASGAVEAPLPPPPPPPTAGPTAPPPPPTDDSTASAVQGEVKAFSDKAKDTKGEFDPGDFFPSWWETIQGVMLAPETFFARMPKSGDYGSPALFAALSMLIGGFGMFLVGTQRNIGSVISTPIGGIIGLFVGAALLWLFIRIFGEQGQYETGFRVLAYASGAATLTWIPFIGWIAGLYEIYLVIIGVSISMQMSRGKAAAVVLVPAIIVTIIILGIVITVGAAVFAGMAGAGMMR